MSQKLSKDQVQHIADLARIGISSQESEKFQEDLGAILSYVEKLEKVDVSGVAPTAHASGLENQMRGDENGSSHADPKVLIGMAPEVEEGYVKVKQVMKK